MEIISYFLALVDVRAKWLLKFQPCFEGILSYSSKCTTFKTLQHLTSNTSVYKKIGRLMDAMPELISEGNVSTHIIFENKLFSHLDVIALSVFMCFHKTLCLFNMSTQFFNTFLPFTVFHICWVWICIHSVIQASGEVYCMILETSTALLIHQLLSFRSSFTRREELSNKLFYDERTAYLFPRRRITSLKLELH